MVFKSPKTPCLLLAALPRDTLMVDYWLAHIGISWFLAMLFNICFNMHHPSSFSGFAVRFVGSN